jgi:hypothetical protein
MGRLDYASIDPATATTVALHPRDDERKKTNSRPATRRPATQTDISLGQLDLFAQKIQVRRRDRSA